MSAEIVVIGGGIIGCTAAALLAERGATVTLYEATAIAAGASGRNSGAVQHPFDAVLLPLHRETLRLYRELAETDAGFDFPQHPAGILLLTDDPAAAGRRADELAAAFADLAPETLDGDALRDAEPTLAEGLVAMRLATGYPIPPHAATHAWAERTRRAGARVEIGHVAAPMVAGGRIIGVRLDDGRTHAADAVLLATGPWTPALLDPTGSWRPIVRTWGVTVRVRLQATPRHILEEGVVHTVNRVAEAGGEAVESLFSLIGVEEVGTVGSTFALEEPDPASVAPVLIERGARLVPSLAHATVLHHRICARPQSVDGRPLVGRLLDGLVICAGHGPWGISTGPATARLAVDALLDGAEVARELAADRFGRPPTAA